MLHLQIVQSIVYLSTAIEFLYTVGTFWFQYQLGIAGFNWVRTA